jgi:S1/P1 Nuclease
MAKLAALVAAPLLLYFPSALAWGGLGHEVICELAFLELDDTARQRVIALIRQDQEFTTFRASCNWADRPRQRASEHFVNFPRDATGLDDDECPMADHCVVSAIEHDFAVLASPNTSDEEKLAALKFLGHWVGDIHQPLHAASQGDRGGNHIRTLGSSCESLHTLWDSCIVEERLGMQSARDRARASGGHHRRAAGRVVGQQSSGLGKRVVRDRPRARVWVLRHGR